MFCRAMEIGLLASRIYSVCPKGALYIGLNYSDSDTAVAVKFNFIEHQKLFLKGRK